MLPVLHHQILVYPVTADATNPFVQVRRASFQIQVLCIYSGRTGQGNHGPGQKISRTIGDRRGTWTLAL